MQSTLYSLASLLSLAYASETGPGFIAFSVTRSNNATSNNTLPSDLDKRDAPSFSLQNLVTIYEAQFEIGTPPKTYQASVDTGSSDLWIWDSSSGAPNGYDHTKSSTSKYVNDGFNIGYEVGGGGSGNYYNDVFVAGSSSVPVQFGVSNETWANGDSSMGVLGLSFENIEGSNDGAYTNLPYALKDSGVINTVAYSLYLDDYDASSGTLLFGAVDSSKYTGHLTTLDLVNDHSFTVNFTVNGVDLQGNFDSGTSLIYLPASALNPIVQNQFANQLTYDSQLGLYRLNSQDRPSGNVTFTFNDVDITLGPNELWIKLAYNSWYLAIGPSENINGYVMLGDAFLRSAYVVYDLENYKVAIAKANYDGSTSNYQYIENGVIPGAE